MRVLRKILWGLLLFIGLSALGGYIYFDHKFEPEPNYLQVQGDSTQVPLKWLATPTNPNAALVLPVKVADIDQTFYMQLDFGSPITLFYRKTLKAIQTVFPKQIPGPLESSTIGMELSLGDLNIQSKTFRLLEHGDALALKTRETPIIIGTLGTDLLEKRTIALHFKDNHCTFSKRSLDDTYSAFEFEKRRILLPATLEGKTIELLYDSGTSGYELITDKTNWEKYRIAESKVQTEQANSWGKPLDVHTATAQKTIEMGGTKLMLKKVTYIDGTSFVQNMLMRFSGMQGMLGNAIFMDRSVTLDCKNERFYIE